MFRSPGDDDHLLKRLAAMRRNRWPRSIGIGGRNESESVAAMPRNAQALREPVVDRSEQLVGFLGLVLLLPETNERARARGGGGRQGGAVRTARLVLLQALHRALATRQPLAGLFDHSDRASQYCSDDYQRFLKWAGMIPSMSGKGNCHDNAMVETGFKTTDIPQMTYKFVKIVPSSHRQGNCIPFAAARRQDFGYRPALGRPFGHFFRHRDTLLPLF